MGRPANLRINVTSDSRQAQTDIQQAEGGIMGSLGKLKAAGPAAAAAAAAAIGAAMVDAFGKALEQGKITARLGAQLGTTPAEAARLGKVAGQLYTKGIVEDFQQGADTISAIMRSGLAPPGTTTKQLQEIATKAGDLASVFGQDVQGAARAAAQMVKTGLVKNSAEAFDVLTRGFQTGANSADDLLDTFNEYSTQFRDMGIDGKTAMGLIQQGLQGGARDADLVADAFKELNIRVKDQSGAKAIQALGLNAAEMARQFATGGPTAAASLDTLLDRLRAVQDPAERTRLAVQLLGTQSEDLARALFALDPSQAVAALGQVDGAAAKMGDSLRDNASARVQEFQRTAQQKLVDFTAQYLVPALQTAYKWWNDKIAPVVRKVADVYADYLAPILATVREGVQKLTEKVQANRDKWQPLWEIIKNKLMPTMSRFTSDQLDKLITGLGYLIDALSEVASWIATVIGWIRDLKHWFDSIKIPDWLQGSRAQFSPRVSSSSFQATSLLAAPAGAAQTAQSAVQARFAPAPVTVNVSIDGQQLQGRITRTVNSALNYDGNRYLAGGWA